MSNFSSILSSVGESTKVIRTIKDTLIMLGLSPDEPCDITTLSNKISKLATDLLKDVSRTMASIATEIGMNFLMTYATLFATYGAGKLNAILDVVVNEFVMGSIVGGFLSLITAALSVLPGCELLLQYLGVETLRKNLYLRNTLAKLLLDYVDRLYNFFKMLEDISYYRDNLPEGIRYYDIEAAILELESAQRKLSIEVGRSKRNLAVNPDNIKYVDDKLISAIDILLNNEYTKSLNDYAKIAMSHGFNPPAAVNLTGKIAFDQSVKLSSDAKSLGNTHLINDYIFQIKDELTAMSKDHDIVISLLKELLPAIPASLQMIIMQELFKNDLKLLTDKFPVFIKNINSDLIDKMTSPLSDLKSKYNIESLKDNVQLDKFFTDVDTKDLTFGSISTKIRLNEAVILLFPTMWKQIKKVGKLYINLFKRVLANIGGVISEMRSTTESAKVSLQSKGFKTNFRPNAAFLHDAVPTKNTVAGVSTEANVLAQKMKWTVVLNQTRGLLKPMLSNSASMKLPGGITVDPLTLASVTEEAGTRLDYLKNFIVNKTYDKDSGEKLKEPYEDILALAQKTIPAMATNIALLLFPTFLTKTKGQLRSLQVNLIRQITTDDIEISLCDDYISYIKNSPIYPTLMEMKKILEKMQSSPIGKTVNDVLNGDLTDLIAITENVKSITDTAEILTCISPTATSGFLGDVMSVAKSNPLSSASTEDLINLQEWITKKLNTIQNTISETLVITTALTDTIAKFSSLVPNIESSNVSTAIKANNTLNNATEKNPAYFSVDDLTRGSKDLWNLYLNMVDPPDDRLFDKIIKVWKGKNGMLNYSIMR